MEEDGAGSVAGGAEGPAPSFRQSAGSEAPAALPTSRSRRSSVATQNTTRSGGRRSSIGVGPTAPAPAAAAGSTVGRPPLSRTNSFSAPAASAGASVGAGLGGVFSISQPAGAPVTGEAPSFTGGAGRAPSRAAAGGVASSSAYDAVPPTPLQAQPAPIAVGSGTGIGAGKPRGLPAAAVGAGVQTSPTATAVDWEALLSGWASGPWLMVFMIYLVLQLLGVFGSAVGTSWSADAYW